MPVKTILLTALFIFPASIFSQSEGLRTGFRVGIGSAEYRSQNFDYKPPEKFYVQAGGLMVFGLKTWFALRADLQVNFSSVEGWGRLKPDAMVGAYEPYTEKYKNLSLGLPLAFRLCYPGKNFRPYLGTGLMIQANLYNIEEREFDHTAFNAKQGYSRKMGGARPLSYFVCIDVGVEVTEDEKDYYLEFRTFQALSPLGTSDNKDVSMSGFTFGGGILF